MKKYILLMIGMILLIFASSVSSVQMIHLAGVSTMEIIVSENFENMTNGEEWSNDGNWDERHATTNFYIGDTDVADIPQGTRCGQADMITGEAEREINLDFSPDNTKPITMTYKFRYDFAPGNTLTMPGFVKVGESAYVQTTIDSAGNIQIYDNATWVDIVSLADDTWHTIDLEVDLDDSDGIEAVYVWVNGTEYGPYDVQAQKDPGLINSIRVAQYWGENGNNIWVDNIIVYEGVRQ